MNRFLLSSAIVLVVLAAAILAPATLEAKPTAEAAMDNLNEAMLQGAARLQRRSALINRNHYATSRGFGKRSGTNQLQQRILTELMANLAAANDADSLNAYLNAYRSQNY